MWRLLDMFLTQGMTKLYVLVFHIHIQHNTPLFVQHIILITQEVVTYAVIHITVADIVQ